MPRMLTVLLLAGACAPALAADLPIFDAHIHYSHDAWEIVPPKEAIAILRKAGVKRALVSSSNDEGTQNLAAPGYHRLELHSYRSRGRSPGRAMRRRIWHPGAAIGEKPVRW